ncbi:hypothetical protein P152DRAFT_471683 [Eremomyces bilateralis CBS 781.70]|uniref:GPI anchored protein n=1 Tax=Eremomyces bilateralis CBS 781.70 TaxID=1392243 RepID=A0A6G1GAD3_9PEZI|nr:uncharacterized protein P152DRAFT_471683 [Eremomyces bilateralis CBS 781.70]KAF1815038.1 hypothetical protein P152DRAFT_471683 [Eremomyces bilateralis CBS 781.70]
MMLSRSVIISVLAAVAVAAAVDEFATLVDLFPPDISIGASIVGSDDSATTYVVACATFPAPNNVQADKSACSEFGTVTMTQGPETFHYATATVITELNPPATVTADLDCSFAGTVSAVCTQVVDGIPPLPTELSELQAQLAVFPMTTTLTGDEMPPLVPVTITAGGSGQGQASEHSMSSGMDHATMSSGMDHATMSGGGGRPGTTNNGTSGPAQTGGPPSPTGAGTTQSGSANKAWGSGAGVGVAGVLAAIFAL